MKKIKLFSAVFTLAIGVSALAPTVSAAGIKVNADGKGVVTFTPPNKVDNNITVPETNNPVITVTPPTDDGNGIGNGPDGSGLKLIVPKYDFGETEIKQEDQYLNPKVLSYTDAKDSTKSYYLPPMVIVKDLSGRDESEDPGWIVRAKATPFLAGSNELNGAAIQFGASGSNQLYNNTKKDASGAVKDNDQNVSGDPNFTLPVSIELNNVGFQTIMTASKAKGGGQTTLVPDTAANQQAIVSSKGSHYSANDTVAGVKLFIPASAIRTQATYTSTITWELETTPTT